MTKIDIYNMDGKVCGDLELNDEIFGVEPNQDVLHRVVVNQLANRRQGTSKTKGRSEVSGGGRKPYRQKGTGRARQGSIRAANHVGGGIIFGPTPRDYSYKLPKKMRRLAMKSALSLCSQAKMRVLDNFELGEVKTRKVVDVLKNLELAGTTLVVMPESDQNLLMSARNIPTVKVSHVHTLNVFDLLKYDHVLFTKEAVEKVEEVYI